MSDSTEIAGGSEIAFIALNTGNFFSTVYQSLVPAFGTASGTSREFSVTPFGGGIVKSNEIGINNAYFLQAVIHGTHIAANANARTSVQGRFRIEDSLGVTTESGWDHSEYSRNTANGDFSLIVTLGVPGEIGIFLNLNDKIIPEFRVTQNNRLVNISRAELTINKFTR